MRYRYLASLLLSLSALTVPAQQISPLAKAMLDGYSKVLSDNPKDYQTLYERAAQYYNLSNYDAALLDISKSIEYTPAKETALLSQEYSLLTDIRMQLGEYEKALDAVDKALGYNPESYADIYKKGNICLYLNKPDEAYRAFTQLQRFKNRSQEAFFGMAKARIMQGNTSEAKALMNEAEKAFPGNWLTYCRLGDLERDMKNNDAAATRYISAFALAENTSRPLESLLSLGAEDYASVARAFDSAIAQTQNKLPLYFLKANIANRAGAYNDAADTFSLLLKDEQGQAPGVYASYAESLMALNRLPEAVEAAHKAADGSPTVANFSLLSRCLLGSGDAREASLIALKAYSADPSSPEAMEALAEAQSAAGNYNEALTVLNELIMSNPENLGAIVTRASIKDKSGDLQGAKGDYQRGANFLPQTKDETILVAFCKNKLGKIMDAEALVSPLAPDADKDTAFMLAGYYAQTGDVEKGRSMLQRAVSQGYANLYELNADTNSLLNVSPLR